MAFNFVNNSTILTLLPWTCVTTTRDLNYLNQQNKHSSTSIISISAGLLWLTLHLKSLIWFVINTAFKRLIWFVTHSNQSVLESSRYPFGTLAAVPGVKHLQLTQQQWHSSFWWLCVPISMHLLLVFIKPTF